MAITFNPFTGNFDITGANQKLSNLQSPTAINQDLLPATDASRQIGDSGLTFLNVYSQTLTTDSIQTLGNNPVIDVTGYQLLDTTGTAIIDFGNPLGATTITQTALDNSTNIATTAYVDTAIATLPDPIVYKGTWSAATNTPTLSNSDTGVEGYLYQVITAGTVNFGAGPIIFEIGDKVVNNGTAWEKWDMTDAVASVNGQTGFVVLDTDDINEGTTNLYFTDARARTAVGLPQTSGSIPFSNGTDFSQDNANFFWDDTNNRLGIGTNSPANALHISKSASGGAVAGIVQNTSATASSDAHIRLTTATGGGNPHVIVNYDSTYWSFGLNQPDNTFRISSAIDLTTATALAITNTGVINIPGLTASRVVTTDASKNLASSAVTTTELGYVSGVTSSIQTQLNTLSTDVAGRATTTLNNLGTTSINAALIPNIDNLRNLGTASLRWFNIYSSSNNVNITNVTNAAGGNAGLLSGTAAAIPSGTSANVRLGTVTVNNPLGIFTVNDATANATGTGLIDIASGNKTAGTGNSGAIRLITGTSTGGTRGDIFLSGNQVNVNNTKIINVTTPTNANDAANKTYVDTAVAGRATTTLNNLGTTSINANLLPSADNTRVLGSAALTWLRGYINKIASASGDQIDISGRSLQFDGSSVATWFNNGFQLLTSKILRFTDSGGTNTVGLKPPTTLAASIDYTLPSAAPSVNGQYLASTTAGVMSWVSPALPTVQKFTSGSGTYTTPAGVKWIRVTMVGAGGGSGGSGTSGTATAGTGGSTTFGTSLLTCAGGSGGTFGGAGGIGGGPTINSPAVALEAVPGGNGDYAGTVNTASVALSGAGGSSMLGGAGGSMFNSAGYAGRANSGGGASGAGGNGSNTAGSGGGAGAGLRAIITSPDATYAYAVGAGGTAGTGTAFNGAAGADGVIIVEEFYN